MVNVPMAPLHKMQQRSLVMHAGMTTILYNLTKVFYPHTYQELTNFLDWDYIAQANQTKIVVCTTIDVRRFKGDQTPTSPLTVPTLSSKDILMNISLVQTQNTLCSSQSILSCLK
jgi:hypothetical protein